MSSAEKVAKAVEIIADDIDTTTKSLTRDEYDDVLGEVIDLLKMKRRAAKDGD